MDIVLVSAPTYKKSKSERGSSCRIYGGRDPLSCLRALTESVLEQAGEVAEVAHASCSGGASSLTLDAPVVGTFAGVRVTASRALALLNVVRPPAATNAESVRLTGALSKRGRTFRLLWPQMATDAEKRAPQ
jgi:hypothetical protein